MDKNITKKLQYFGDSRILKFQIKIHMAEPPSALYPEIPMRTFTNTCTPNTCTPIHYTLVFQVVFLSFKYIT